MLEFSRELSAYSEPCSRRPQKAALELPRPRQLLAAAVLTLAAACGDPRVLPIQLDFVEGLPLAEVHSETFRVDFGSPEARRHYREGWSSDEADSDVTYVWGMGEASSLELYFVAPGERTLTVRCWPFSHEGAPTQTVELLVNGSRIGELRLERQLARYRFSIPRTLVRRGPNRIEFRYGHHRRPNDVDPNSQDPRSLAVAWSDLRVEGAARPREPAVRRSEETALLVLPRGVQLDYYAKLGPNAYFTVDAIRSLPRDEDEGGTLELRVETDTDGLALERLLPVTSKPQVVALPVAAEKPFRVSLRVDSAPGVRSLAGALELVQPALRAPFARGERPALRTDAPETAQRVQQRPNVLLYVVDTLRADHLGAYGYPKPTSPNLDAFARDATLFSRALASTSWTRPAVASILTGLRATSHGVNDREHSLAPAALTLAEVLQEQGYRTAGFVTNANVCEGFGFAQGFEVYSYLGEDLSTPEVHQPASRIHAAALEWLRARPEGAPFFLYLHASDPHGPYAPPEPFRTEFAGRTPEEVGTLPFLHRLDELETTLSDRQRRELVGLYDAEIAYLDLQFGAFLRSLRGLEVYDSTLIVFVADHGEEFFEHGWWQHGKTLYSEQLQVPLIIRFPSGWESARMIHQIAQQEDIFPTILGYLRIDAPEVVDGESLIHTIGGARPAPESRPVFAYLDLDDRAIETISVDGLKLIDYSSFAHPRGTFIHPDGNRPGGQLFSYTPTPELFDLSSDAAEEQDLAAQRPIAVGYLRSQLRALRAADAKQLLPNPVSIDEELEERLRLLGYAP